MSTVPTPSTVPPPVWQWPADVLEFAAQRGITAYLDPLLEATRRLFPTARLIQVFCDRDRELRDVSWIVFDVQVPKADVPSYSGAKRAWHDAFAGICPMPLAQHFILSLNREDK